MARILIIGNPLSPLVRERGLIGQQAGHQIFWVFLRNVDLPGVTMFSLPAELGGVRLVRQALLPLLLCSTIWRVRPHLIHVHYALQSLSTLPLLTYHPLLVTVMGGDILPDQSYHGFHARLGRALLDRADCITSKSDFMDSALARIGDYHAKIRRVTWGVDLDHFRPGPDAGHLRAKWSIPSGDLVFLDPRLAQPFYNKHVILSAFARYLQAGGTPATLVVSELLADPVYVAGLRQQARDLGVAERVRFVGNLDRSEISDYYRLADATISIPPSDGLPQTIYEAMACGSFLILGNLPQYQGIVEDGRTARLVPPGDTETLAAAMSWVAAHPEVRAAAAKAGRAYVERHADRRAQAQLVNQIYAELLESHSRR